MPGADTNSLTMRKPTKPDSLCPKPKSKPIDTPRSTPEHQKALTSPAQAQITSTKPETPKIESTPICESDKQKSHMEILHPPKDTVHKELSPEMLPSNTTVATSLPSHPPSMTATPMPIISLSSKPSEPPLPTTVHQHKHHKTTHTHHHPSQGIKDTASINEGISFCVPEEPPLRIIPNKQPHDLPMSQTFTATSHTPGANPPSNDGPKSQKLPNRRSQQRLSAPPLKTKPQKETPPNAPSLTRQAPIVTQPPVAEHTATPNPQAPHTVRLPLCRKSRHSPTMPSGSGNNTKSALQENNGIEVINHVSSQNISLPLSSENNSVLHCAPAPIPMLSQENQGLDQSLNQIPQTLPSSTTVLQSQKPPLPYENGLASQNSLKSEVQSSDLALKTDCIEKEDSFEETVCQPNPAKRRKQCTPAMQVKWHKLTMRHSALSIQEHRRYLFLEEKVIEDKKQQENGEKPYLEEQDHMELKNLRMRVEKERQEYFDHSLHEVKVNKEYFSYIHVEVRAQVEEYITALKAKVKAYYPRYYIECGRLDIRNINSSPTSPDHVLTPVARLFENGEILECNPKIVTKYLSPASSEELHIPPHTKLFFKESKATEPTTKWRKQVMPLVSEDATVKALISCTKVDVVLSSSVLKALAGTAYAQPWELPGLIVSTSPPGCTTPIRTLLLDKPLVKQQLTPREVNTLFYKAAFQTRVLWHLKGDEAESLELESENVPENVSSHLGKGGVSLLAKIPLPHGWNQTYYLWSLGELNILIRCKIHSMMTTPDSPSGFWFTSLFPKLHYRLSVGLEDEVSIDVAQWWIHTYIRPRSSQDTPCKLLLGNIDVFKSSLHSLELRDFKEILKPGHTFKPEVTFKYMHYILRGIAQQPIGQYMIHYNAPYIKIMRSTPTPAPPPPPQASFQLNIPQAPPTYDLHKSQETAGSIDLSSTYLSYRRIWKHVEHRIPYTFPPLPPLPDKPIPIPEEEPHIPHCFIFTKTGACSQGLECPYPHWNSEQLNREMQFILAGYVQNNHQNERQPPVSKQKFKQKQKQKTKASKKRNKRKARHSELPPDKPQFTGNGNPQQVHTTTTTTTTIPQQQQQQSTPIIPPQQEHHAATNTAPNSSNALHSSQQEPIASSTHNPSQQPQLQTTNPSTLPPNHNSL
ncbi:hypothetical protein Pelo_4168 [Pelomyxa schiedti]|nr:hypothetical protein Pelo_4168 [Pelomyxa schiedti]